MELRHCLWKCHEGGILILYWFQNHAQNSQCAIYCLHGNPNRYISNTYRYHAGKTIKMCCIVSENVLFIYNLRTSIYFLSEQFVLWFNNTIFLCKFELFLINIWAKYISIQGIHNTVEKIKPPTSIKIPKVRIYRISDCLTRLHREINAD